MNSPEGEQRVPLFVKKEDIDKLYVKDSEGAYISMAPLLQPSPPGASVEVPGLIATSITERDTRITIASVSPCRLCKITIDGIVIYIPC
jgi:hypothetical protein